MAFEKIKIENSSITVFEAHGTIDYNDIRAELIDYYNNEPTLHCIWDFSEGELSSLTNDNIHKLVAKELKLSKGRFYGKTALVAKDSYTFGICRMAQLIGSNRSATIEINVFYSKAKALRWLG